MVLNHILFEIQMGPIPIVYVFANIIMSHDSFGFFFEWKPYCRPRGLWLRQAPLLVFIGNFFEKYNIA